MLDETETAVVTERSTSKQPLTDPDVRELLRAADKVIIARGKSRRELAPGDTRLEDLKGPTGNYRAPMIAAGGTLLVGFSAEALSEILR